MPLSVSGLPGSDAEAVVGPEEVFPGGKVNEGRVLGIIRRIPAGDDRALWYAYTFHYMETGQRCFLPACRNVCVGL